MFRFNVIIIIVICTLLLVSIVLSLKQRKETFYNLSQLSLNLDMKPEVLIINYDDDNKSSKIEKQINDIKGIEFDYNSKIKRDSQLNISDIYNFTLIAKNDPDCKIFTIAPDKKNMIFLLPKNVDSPYIGQTVRNIAINNGITIGYMNKNEDELIRLLCISSNIPESNVKTKKISLSLITDVDCIFILNSMNNPIIMGEKFLDATNKRYNFFEFSDDVDINKIKFYLPYVIKENIVISDYFKERKDLTQVYGTFSIDMVLWGFPELENNDALNEELHTINVRFQNFDIINYYTMYFEFFKQTEAYTRLENKHISKRESLPILEQFKNIPGFYDNTKHTLQTTEVEYDVPFIPKDTIYLNDQDRDEENGTYTVVSVGQETLLKKLNFTNITNDEDGYICYNNPLVKDAGFCDEGYWDKPCKKNEECPFYQANKTYRNYRGGCYNGVCEMPLGIKRKAFKNYESKFQPWCYGCKSLTPECCDMQKQPDYAYPLDQFEKPL